MKKLLIIGLLLLAGCDSDKKKENIPQYKIRLTDGKEIISTSFDWNSKYRNLYLDGQYFSIPQENVKSVEKLNGKD